MPYCAKCGGEFVEGVAVCPDCGVPLTERPPRERADGGPSPEAVQWESVLETGDPALLAVAKSVLQNAGIPFVVIGEGLQNLEGGGGLGIGYNQLFGPATLRVPPDRAATARDLLAEQPDEAADAGGDEAADGATPGRRGAFFAGAAAGLLIGIVAALAIDEGSERLRRRAEIAALGGEGEEYGQRLDVDGDGRPDYWARYEDGVLRSTASDTNYDGKHDDWWELDRHGHPISARSDENFDGQPDRFTRYEEGRPVAIEQDTDFDGRFDFWSDLDERGQSREERSDVNGDGRPDRWFEYDDAGQIRADRKDLDFDGTPDEVYEYEPGARLARGRRDTDFDGTFDQSLTFRNDQRDEATWEARPSAPARKLTYRHGVLREELRDRDADGSWDLRILYDPFEFPVEEVELGPEPP